MQAARDCLGPESAVARALPGFRPRREQLAMAEAVEEALADGQHLLVEAGTGVGKSFAYLVPTLLAVAHGAGPIVVATRTIALQEQLVEKDIPFLVEALDAGRVKIALAKGRGNYVCRRRLAMAHAEGAGLFDEPAKREQLATILEWAETSADGTRSDLTLRPAPEVWDAVKAESGNCLHQRCPFFKECAYQRSRRALHEADLVVANHALVFADLALRERGVSLLPDYKALVLDEAHEIEDGASDNFGAYVSSIGIARQLGRFMGRRRRTGLFGRAEVKPALYTLLEQVRQDVRVFFDGVTRWRGGESERRIREPFAFADNLTRPLGELVQALRERHEEIEDVSLAIEWKARTDRLDETRDAIRLIHNLMDGDLVYWAEASGRDRSVLRAAPIEIAALMRRTVFSKVRSVVMTSATISIGGTFEHFKRRVGLEEPNELGLGSPFDFSRQCRLVLYPRLPDPRDPAWEPEAIARMRELVLRTGGGAFLLFTAYRALQHAHDELKKDFEEAGLRILRQGADVRTKDIVAQFHAHDNCVLFGTDTFWQGIDVRGRNLRLVTIAKLPFAVPTHPLQQARVERIEEDGGDAFGELSLPQAVLKLRQGFGRLIRSAKDMGTVAILDSRIRTKRYGRIFLNSLPRCRVEERD